MEEREIVDRVLFSAEDIERRVQELGAEISRDYERERELDPHKRPLLVVGLLKGALPFMADLIRSIQVPLEYDFIAVSSYANGTSPGEVRVLKDLERAVGGRDLLIVEDIVDTGHTLRHITRRLQARDPASIKICTLLDKPHRREVQVKVDYVGFELEDPWFVVGYGLDFGELYRNLAYIGALRAEYVEGEQQ